MELCVPSLKDFQATNEELFDARSLSESFGLVRKPSIGGRAFLLDYSRLNKSIDKIAKLKPYKTHWHRYLLGFDTSDAARIPRREISMGLGLAFKFVPACVN